MRHIGARDARGISMPKAQRQEAYWRKRHIDARDARGISMPKVQEAGE